MSCLTALKTFELTESTVWGKQLYLRTKTETHVVVNGLTQG
jgi:hypothetical protein